jgi:hypothetical protein
MPLLARRQARGIRSSAKPLSGANRWCLGHLCASVAVQIIRPVLIHVQHQNTCRQSHHGDNPGRAITRSFCPISLAAEGRGRVTVDQLALTYPNMRLSRTRLFPKVTRAIYALLGPGTCDPHRWQSAARRLCLEPVPACPPRALAAPLEAGEAVSSRDRRSAEGHITVELAFHRSRATSN